MEKIIVGTVVALACWFLFRRLRSMIRGGGCGCGCSGCPSASSCGSSKKTAERVDISENEDRI